MKKLLLCFLTMTLLLSAAACGTKQPPKADMEPTATQMKSICELAVMECYYHNVAKFHEDDASGVLWWKKDKDFWIEYSGIVKVGVDVSLVTMDIDDTVVTITIPEAEVLSCKVDSSSLTEESYIISGESASIDAKDEILAFDEAQRQLKEAASGNKALLVEAQQRAQSLLEDYVTNIGNAIGKTYTVKWKYLSNPSTGATKSTEETVSETNVSE